MPNLNLASSLHLAAEVYSALGYAVIPLLGDASPDHPKATAIPWNDYRKRKPTPDEIRHWFTIEGFQGIGILTGRISGLVVLDFDSEPLFRDFSLQYPELVERHVIQTRRGFHLYFQLPAHLSLSSRKGTGIDLLADGRYVVARPTTIAGFTYKLIRGGQPRILTPRDIARITQFLDQHAPSLDRAPAAVQPIEASPSEPTLRPSDLQALYRYQVGQGRGRNEALFSVALTARNSGCSLETTLQALAELHARTPSATTRSESEPQRHREAQRTIQSAFSHPARPKQRSPKAPSQLPTGVRERLFQLKLTCIVRVIEGLREKGIQTGQTFTRQEAWATLRGLVGRNSLDHALNATVGNGQRLFGLVSPPDHPPRYAASHSHTPDYPKCFLGGGTKPGESLQTRPSHRHQMPTNATLNHLLGVSRTSSDRIDLDDLSSAKKTRLAAHRAFLQRRPGQYPRRWLAARLGVCSRTTRRYDFALHVHIRPMFHETAITWQTLSHIPDFPITGTFLEDENGKRYPARREIACTLLASGHLVAYKRQDANFYSLDPPPVVSLQVLAREQVWKARQQQIEQHVVTEQSRAGDIPASPTPPAMLPRAAVPSPQLSLPQRSSPPRTSQKPLPRLSSRRYRQPLPDAAQEALAQRVYTSLNQQAGEAKHHISQANARRCVETYGARSVERTLKRVTSRRNIYSPVGFFFIILRSESKISSPKMNN